MPSIVKLTLESNQYERNLRNAQRQWEDFMRGMGMSVSKFTAVGAAVAGVTGALKVAKDAFKSNENTLDEWGRTVESAKGIYNGFLDALNNSDISGFLSRIDDIVSAAREAYNAMDELNTFTAFNQVQSARGKAGYAKALDEYKVNPTAENKAVLDAANRAVIENIKAQQEYTKEAYKKALANLATQRGLTGKQRDDFISMFQNKSYAELQAAKSSYSTGRLLNAGSQYYYGDRVWDGKTQDRVTGKWSAMTESQKQQFEFARALSQTNDDQIKAVQALGAQAEQLGEAIYQQDRTYNRLAGNNGKVGTGGGGSKSGKVGKTQEIYAADSIAAQEKLVSDLTKRWREAGAAVREQYKKELEDAKYELGIMNGSIKPIGTIAPVEIPTTLNLAEDKMEALQNATLELIAPLQQLENELKRLQEEQAKTWTPEQFAAYQQKIDEVNKQIDTFKGKKLNKDAKDSEKSWHAAAGAISSVGSALQSIDDPAAKVIGLIAQAIASVAAGAGQAISARDTTASGWAWIGAAAAITAQMVAIISTIHSATGYAHGGEIKGNTYSGDQIPIMANAGEVVLTRAMAGNLASQLQGNGQQNLHLTATISGEQIRLALNNNGRRTGRGEYVTTNFR